MGEGRDWGSCPFCGSPIRRKPFEVLGRTYWRPVPCGCSGAAAKRQADAERKAAEEAQAEERHFASRARKAGVPDLYASAKTPERFSGWDFAKDGGLYIWGGNGTFKTATAAAVALDQLRRGARVRFTSLQEVSEQANGAMKRGEDGSAVVWRCKSCGLLVLDDLGKETLTAAQLRTLFGIVDYRYSHMLPLVVTSNFSLPQMAARMAQVDESTAMAVASRLSEMCRDVMLDGPDARLGGVPKACQ